MESNSKKGDEDRLINLMQKENKNLMQLNLNHKEEIIVLKELLKEAEAKLEADTNYNTLHKSLHSSPYNAKILLEEKDKTIEELFINLDNLKKEDGEKIKNLERDLFEKNSLIK